MSLSKCGISICPCCNQESLQSNGGFFICANCGLAITTQALLRAVEYTYEASRFETVTVISSN